MLDSYNRNINYLRISVTDRCNLRCRYCMPEKGAKLKHQSEILSYEEIYDFTKFAVSRGISKVRITGGEPLVRSGIERFIEMLAGIPGIQDLSMTTNGVYLEKYAVPLKNAGLMRVNVSLDTLDEVRYHEITRIGDIQPVLRGIRAAVSAGLNPVKLNCVVQKSRNEPDAERVTEFAKNNNIEVRYIRQMDLNNGTFYQVDGGEGGKCSTCNRIRLTSNGDLRPCLFNQISYNIREYGNETAFQLAVSNKPVCGSLNFEDHFYNIGG